ncbi:hypothetical protein CDV31_009680 [Fusarium ambrosium]|uniref:Uncharacterized protein n=1 Tax=Fusarium ambrosium TaxID=131363 RepID=A0A428TTC9_9HYPO|nr:hypothetical protein CDV31_009680 [Fusarium ambrosium]
MDDEKQVNILSNTGGSTESTMLETPPAINSHSTSTSARRHMGRLSSGRDVRRRLSRLVHPAMKRTEKLGDPLLMKTMLSPETALPKRGQEVKCTLQSIMEKLKPDSSGRPRPEFDSLEIYNVSRNTTKSLRKAEAERLRKVVQDPTTPVTMASCPYLEEMKTDSEGYRHLSLMSQTISTALSLCLLDNECVNAKFCARIANRERIDKLIQQARAASESEPVPPGVEGDDGMDKWLSAIFELVHYISAILARLISQTGDGKFWLENILATLVARTVKLKFLLVDIASNAQVSAANGQQTLEETKGVGGFSVTIGDDEEECEEALRIIDAQRKEGLSSDEEAEVAAFCVSQSKYQSGLNAALKYVLLSLRLSSLTGLPATTYEMCLIVYEIGFEGFKTILFQDRDLEYSASSDRDVLNTAQSALIILNQVISQLDRKEPADTDETIIEWTYTGVDDPNGNVDYTQLRTEEIALRSLVNVVRVMVPVAFSSPILLANLTGFRTMMALTGDVKDVVRPFREGQFGAFYRLYTKAFDDEAKGRDILRLSQAFKSHSFSRCRLLADAKGKWRNNLLGAGEPEYMSAEALAKLTECSQRMDGWVVDETSVTIPCRRYVSTVVSSALALAGGGLAIGFTVGDRIEGVDPFNLATYAWVLAAFIVLVCKAILVEGWAWSDFLRWRVRCHSVSELVATTGMDEQVIIAKLLHEDCGDGILTTRGPFNSVFRNQAEDAGGFSIDRPIHPSTLILSGLGLLKVVTPRGHAIVCLDHRRGTVLTAVEHTASQDKRRLICEDADRHTKDNAVKHRTEWRSSPRPAKLRLTSTEDFKWKRVQGFYNFQDANVVFT